MASPESCKSAQADTAFRWRQVIGARIRVFREFSGLSRNALAERVGLSEHQMRAVESGALEISRGLLTRIAQPLAIPLHLLIAESAAGAPDLAVGEENATAEEQALLMEHFNAIDADDLRQRLLETVKRLADTGEPPQD